MTRFKSIDVLALDTINKSILFGVKPKQAGHLFAFTVDLLKPHMEKSKVMFSVEIAIKTLELYKIQVGEGSRFNGVRRNILLLIDNYNDNLKEYKLYPIPRGILKSEHFKNVLSDYTSFLQAQGKAKKTVVISCQSAKNLFYYLSEEGIVQLDDITSWTIGNYCASKHFSNRSPIGVKSELRDLKSFILYLIDAGVVSNISLKYSVPNPKIVVNKVVTVLTPNQTSELMSDYPNSICNLRDKAICSFALYCGLRSCDILNLKFSNIDWEKKEIKLIQIKTGISLRLPLNYETLDSLSDYIIKERRKCDIDYIFISATGPIRRLTRPIKTKSRLKKSSINSSVSLNGVQILRRTFASNLLRAKTPLPIISSALGHTDKDMVNYYLSTDEESMKKCALEINDIPFTKEDY